MKSVSTMLIHEVHRLAYEKDTSRVVLISVTDEEIEEVWRLPPSAVKVELLCKGDRAKWYEDRLGEYVVMEVRKRHA